MLLCATLANTFLSGKVPDLTEGGCLISTATEPRTNELIRAKEVRVVGVDGQQHGIISIDKALSMAREFELDLVEVAPNETPPVCRIMDYGKFKFDAGQKARESRRKSVSNAIKEMKYRPMIGGGDFDTKTKQVSKFLSQGHKVKLTIMFRSREIYHPELGKRILDKVAEQVEHVGKVEVEPKLEGRNMLMVLAPYKKGQGPKKGEVNEGVNGKISNNKGDDNKGDDSKVGISKVLSNNAERDNAQEVDTEETKTEIAK